MRLVIFRSALDMMRALAVARPSLSKSFSISLFVDAPATESTTIVTNLFLSDALTLSMIVSIVSKTSSIVSNGTYIIFFKSSPIASKNSVETAFSVSMNTASPPDFWVLARTWAASNDLPLCSKPVISVTLPTGNPPYLRLEIAKSNIVAPVETHSETMVGASSSPSKK